MIKICKKSFLTHKLHFKFVINNLYCDTMLSLTIESFLKKNIEIQF